MNRVKICILVLLAAGLLLSACNLPVAAPTSAPPATALPTQALPPPPTITVTPHPTVEPTNDPTVVLPGGVAVVGILQEPGSLSPLFAASEIDDMIASFVVEGLVGIDADGSYVPVLAESLPEVSSDGLLLTYKIKPGIRFSNGDELVCADVQFTRDTILSSLSRTGSSGYSDIETIECPDDYTVVVTLSDLYAPYLNLFSFIVPRSAGDPAVMDSWSYHRAPTGTGPWVVSNWIAGDSIEFTPNPYYRDPGKPYLDRIIVKILPNREMGLQRLAAGEITVFWDLGEADLPIAAQQPGVLYASAAYGSGENELLVFNFADPGVDAPLDPADAPHPILYDLHVRQAIQFAIDKQAIAAALLDSSARPATSVLPAGAFACPLPPSEYNPTKAIALLEQAGWMPGADGIRTNTAGSRLSLKIASPSGSQIHEHTAQLLAEMLNQVGIELLFEALSPEGFFAAWEPNGIRPHGGFDILLYTTGAGIDPDAHLFANYHSAGIPTFENQGTGSNYSRYIHADIDAWIDEAAHLTSAGARRDLYCKVAAQINSDLPRIFIYERPALSGYREELQNFSLSSGFAGLSVASQIWWLQP